MIVLNGARAGFGLPSPSQFVSKAEVLLKMAGVPYRHVDADFSRAPKGKIPFIEEGGRLIGDTSFIRRHLEDVHGADFDKGLTPAEKAVARAFAVMADEHLYWAVVYDRWMDRDNFDRGPRRFFAKVPAPMRPVVTAMVRRGVKASLKGHGLGRHSRDEIHTLARSDIDAIADFLATKPFLMGAEPCGADASVWSAVAQVLCARFETPLRHHAAARPNLVAYRDRGMARWFPDLARGSAARPAARPAA